jgi:hypothetical protein
MPNRISAILLTLLATCVSATICCSRRAREPGRSGAQPTASVEPALEVERRPAARAQAKGDVALVVVLDSSSSGGSPVARCNELKRTLELERANTPRSLNLRAIAIPLGEGDGALHQQLGEWADVQGAQLTDLTESLEDLQTRTQAEQEKRINRIVAECAAHIHPSSGSPVGVSVQRAAELLRHECDASYRSPCSEQRIAVHSDLQDPAIMASSELLLEPSEPIRVRLCGYAASDAVTTRELQKKLLARWRQRLGPNLAGEAPVCAGASSGMAHG